MSASQSRDFSDYFELVSSGRPLRTVSSPPWNPVMNSRVASTLGSAVSGRWHRNLSFFSGRLLYSKTSCVVWPLDHRTKLQQAPLCHAMEGVARCDCPQLQLLRLPEVTAPNTQLWKNPGPALTECISHLQDLATMPNPSSPGRGPPASLPPPCQPKIKVVLSILCAAPCCF